MERLKEAINKAKAGNKAGRAASTPSGGYHDGTHPKMQMPPRREPPVWSPPRVRLDADLLERNRIVSYARTDASHVAFNLLRTKIRRMMQENNWKTLAVTSPSSGCGKTVVAINLAFSLARQADCRTVLLDLDLKKSSVAKTMGIRPTRSLAEYLDKDAALADCFVTIDDELVFGLNSSPVGNSAEMMQHQSVRDIIPTVNEALQPEVIVFDLPPMLASDDAIAFLPQVDCAILVAAVGMTTPRQIAECENQIATATNMLGVVLNKCAGDSEAYYQPDA